LLREQFLLASDDLDTFGVSREESRASIEAVDVEDSLEIFEHVHHPDNAQLLLIKKILVENSATANESRSTKKNNNKINQLTVRRPITITQPPSFFDSDTI
jgi:hypothetical protein